MARILVIEDEPMLQMDMVDMLGFEDYEVLAASDGSMGLALAEESHPDLILCDIMMPVMNGYEFLEHIKSMPHLQAIPVVMLSAKADLVSIQKALDLGAAAYIKKPFDIAELLETVANFIKPT